MSYEEVSKETNDITCKYIEPLDAPCFDHKTGELIPYVPYYWLNKDQIKKLYD